MRKSRSQRLWKTRRANLLQLNKLMLLYRRILRRAMGKINNNPAQGAISLLRSCLTSQEQKRLSTSLKFQEEIPRRLDKSSYPPHDRNCYRLWDPRQDLAKLETFWTWNSPFTIETLPKNQLLLRPNKQLNRANPSRFWSTSLKTCPMTTLTTPARLVGSMRRALEKTRSPTMSHLYALLRSSTNPETE